VSSPIVLVTGAGSGIGMATAVEFGRRGSTVVATVRSLERSDGLQRALTDAGVVGDVRALDVSSDQSVRKCIAATVAEHGEIDVVISNAGIGIDGTTEELTLDDFRASFETNVLGSVRLLHALLPAWRVRRSGRFVAVGSSAGVIGSPFNDAYCASKFALEGLLESLHPVAAAFGVQVSVVEPGPVAGDFARKHGPPTARTVDGVYARQRDRFQTVQDGGYANAQTNEEVAAVLWEVATADAPAFRYQTSHDVARLVGVKLKDLNGEKVTRLLARWI
jgi:NAD(P)-dependent dehydrogenase (short-subunit alcohol dehydrogenase family)